MKFSECEFLLNSSRKVRGLVSEPQQEVLVGLHGYLDNAASFLPLASFINQFQLMLLDLPGHGRSDPISAQEWGYNFFNQSLDMVELIEEQYSGKKINLMGHSMGAGLSVLIASLLPGHIKKLVLLDNMGPMASPPTDIVTRMREFKKQLQQSKEGKSVESLEEAVNLRVHSGVSKSLANLLAQRGVVEENNKFRWNFDRRLQRTTPIRFTKEQVQTMIASISCPVLLFKAQNNWPEMSRFQEKHYLPYFKDIEVVSLSGGHYSHAEEPSPIGQKITKFLTEEN